MIILWLLVAVGIDHLTINRFTPRQITDILMCYTRTLNIYRVGHKNVSTFSKFQNSVIKSVETYTRSHFNRQRKFFKYVKSHVNQRNSLFTGRPKIRVTSFVVA